MPSRDDEFELDANMSEQERRIRRQVRRQAEFYQHALVYVCVIAGLWLFNFWTINPTKADRLSAYWAIWPTFGWGIGLFFHGMSALPLWSHWSGDWEERKVKELMRRESGR